MAKLRNFLVSFLAQNAPRAFCYSCLAQSVDTTVTGIKRLIRTLLMTGGGLETRIAVCDNCHDVRVTARLMVLPKCARCSQPLTDDDLVMFVHGEVFHQRCNAILLSERLIRQSRARIKRGQDRADKSVARVQRTAVVAAIVHASLCEWCISRKSEQAILTVRRLLREIGEVLTVSAHDARCDGCQESRWLYHIA